MKRVRCPKCGHYLTFDETRYSQGETLVFECPACHKQFGVRLGISTLLSTRKDEKRQKTESPHSDIYTHLTEDDNENLEDFGSLLVVENVFHFRQTLPLHLGDNIIGRYVKGSNINTPIETVDPSVDTTHCILNVNLNQQGKITYTIRDATPDGTGTFVGTTLLGAKDRRRIEDGTIITIGATTMILQAAGARGEETTAEDRPILNKRQSL